MTSAQLAALKTDILADPTLSQLDHTSEAGYEQIAAAYNVLATPDYFVYRSNVPIDEIFNAITWKSLTPADAVPTDTQLNVQTFTARAVACQGYVFNLEVLLQGRLVVNPGNKNFRQGLRDALQAVPSGANGALQDAGWATLRDTVLARKATRAEKLFSDITNGNGSTAANAAQLGFEGLVGPGDISAAFS